MKSQSDYNPLMKHDMRLDEEPFVAIKSGKQTIEVRLFDDKRSLLNVGDRITFFKRPDEVESFEVSVIGLSIFNSFEDLFKAIDKEKFGYEEDDTLEYQIECMRKFYSVDEEAECGVVGIHLKII